MFIHLFVLPTALLCKESCLYNHPEVPGLGRRYVSPGWIYDSWQWCENVLDNINYNIWWHLFFDGRTFINFYQLVLNMGNSFVNVYKKACFPQVPFFSHLPFATKYWYRVMFLVPQRLYVWDSPSFSVTLQDGES